MNNPFSQMATANKLSIQDIQRAVQAGSLPAYIGVPLIEQKTKEAQKMKMAQALMRQMEGGPAQTVSDSVLQAADQVTRPEAPLSSTLPATDRQRPAPSMGIEEAQSNLPTEYAGGGIVAFADGTKDGTAGDVTIPGKENDKELKAAGFEALRDAPVRGRSYRESRDLSAITPYGIDRPVEGGGYEPYTPPTESFADTLSRIGSGVKDFASSTLDPIGGESEGAMQRRLARESYYDTTTPPPRRASIADLGVTPTVATNTLPSFLTKPGEGAASPAPGTFLDRLTGPKAAPTESTSAKPAGDASTAWEPKILRGEAAGQPPAQQSTGFGDIDQSFQDYLSGIRSERQGLKDIILGQQAERRGMEKENTSNALLQAGLGMMAARTPWALTNIGEGGMRGAEAYAKGLDQLRARDDRIIGQLVGLGLKGAELENAAMKAGIDIQHMKQMAPYYESMAEHQRVSSKWLPAKTASDIKLQSSQTAENIAQAQAIPQKTMADLMSALKPPSGGRAAGVKELNPKDKLALIKDYRNQVMQDPMSDPTIMQALRKHPKYAQIMEGLNSDRDSNNYSWATQEIGKIADPIINDLIQSSRSVGGQSASQDLSEE